jgi:hypothetical protein
MKPISLRITEHHHYAGKIHVMQECVKRRICIIRCIVFNAYFTVLNKLARIIRLQSLPALGLFRQLPPKQLPFSELPMLSYTQQFNNISNIGKELEIFRVILGQKSALPKLLFNTIVLCHGIMRVFRN